MPDEARGAPPRARSSAARAAEAAWKRALRRVRDGAPRARRRARAPRSRASCPPGWDADLPTFTTGDEPIATRAAVGQGASTRSRRACPSWSAAPPTSTLDQHDAQGPGDSTPHVADAGAWRRLGYAAATSTSACASTRWARSLNGMALHGGVRPVRRHLLRLLRLHAPGDPARGAHAGCPSIFVFTHDSIGLGEDGPTHQPVEHLASLRAIPNLDVIRPGRRQRDGERLARRAAATRRAGRRSC